jgi:hypothetical protein
MKRKYGKPDANHSQVKQWYRSLGCSIADTKDQGMGVPDLFVGAVGITDPVEVKVVGGKLTAEQETFIAGWRGSKVWIVVTQDDVVQHVTNMRQRLRTNTRQPLVDG